MLPGSLNAFEASHLTVAMLRMSSRACWAAAAALGACDAGQFFLLDLVALRLRGLQLGLERSDVRMVSL